MSVSALIGTCLVVAMALVALTVTFVSDRHEPRRELNRHDRSLR
jgi:multisubunit Na+/H+ antiporter MnhC subunit